MLRELIANCCRICLDKGKKLRSLYRSVDEGDEPPYEMLLKVTGIQVEQTICKNCEMSLSMAFEFREKALQSHEMLMSYMGELQIPHQLEEMEQMHTGSEMNNRELVIKSEEAVVMNSPQHYEETASYVEKVVIEQNIEAGNSGNDDIQKEQQMATLDNKDEQIIDGTCCDAYDNDDPHAEEEFCSNSENNDDQQYHGIESELNTSEQNEVDVLNYRPEDRPEEEIHQELSQHVQKINQKSLELNEEKTAMEIVEDETPQSKQNEVKNKKLGKSGKENCQESLQDRQENLDSIEIEMKSDGEGDGKPLKRGRKAREDGNQLFICDICGNVFSKRSRMREHRQRHDKRPKYECELCDKQFHMRELLRKHMFSHSGGKPHKCEYCSRTFYYESVKKAHEAVHQGLKPYICDVCGKAFSYGHSLKKHKLIHAEVKLYRCEYCNKDFRLQHHMKQHELTKAHRREVQLAGGTIEYQDTMLTPDEEEQVFTVVVEEGACEEG
ncbi:zinc-finger protein isoform X2 [Musca autumnalis]|uniref:zinc-finger protein isoform X2 n=1 Tax=Musca autumnalis TaxID=221902 RepID=UPI003CEE87AB